MGFSVFSDEHYMGEALKEAKLAAAEDEVPIGAVIVCDGKIIARAHNMTERLNDVTAHAEMIAITAAENFLGAKYLVDCTIYVTIEPCPMCAAALGWAQMGKVVYGAPDPKMGYSLIQGRLLHPKTLVVSGLRASECASLMTDFFRKKR
ncbi:MAG: nucleoside deaminase [Bacteroidales bacterium]|jgi:tRNA(adenine34) deaminase|nr:nucleoside deaminase [Bacteroidales bacterium]NPV36058.1 nucleoside deaminase [Bacteroidales bacterium]